ncbi:hypothetical protein B0H13DRAFT_2376488 [Mycena leptocephala]|nr:hypothetical protein B0H13DRAFT_2376488 [Mycena leptocephala]
MSPPKPTHPLAHLPDPPQNYIPCAPTKYWPSTMDEEQHSSQGNKWWWLVYLGPMQGAYATRATAVANVPSASKIENAIEYFDTLTDLNHGWKKSCFHWQGHCPVHFACASVCQHPKPTPLSGLTGGSLRARNFVRAAQRTATQVLNDSASSISSVRMLAHCTVDPTTLLAALAASVCWACCHLSGGWGQGGGVSGGSSQTSEFICIVHPPPPQPQRFLRGVLYPSTLTAPLKTLPPSSSPPAYSPPSWSLSLWSQLDKGLALTRPQLEFSMSTGGKSQYNKPRLFAYEPKPYAKTEPEPRIKLKSGVKQEVKLKPNLQHDVERSCSRSHVPVPLYDPDWSRMSPWVWIPFLKD